MKKRILIISLILSFVLIGCTTQYDTDELKNMDEEFVVNNKTTAFFLGDVQYMDNDLIIESLKEKNIRTITIPIAWSEVEKEENEYSFQVYESILDEYVSNGFEFIFIMDTSGRILINGEDQIIKNEDGTPKTCVPRYVYNKYPNEMMVDFYGEKFNALDFVAGEHKGRIEAFYEKTLSFLKTKYANNILAISPGIINELELKFPQANYKWTSYSDASKAKFINYCVAKYADIDYLNKSLNTKYTSFDEIELPVIDYNNTIENNSINDEPLFVDFMEFREGQLVEYITPFVSKIEEYNFDTIGYFAQFYHPQDAIYATHVIQKCIDLYDMIVVDFNFYDGYKEIYNDMIPAFLTNYAKTLGYKKVFTGIYVERIDYEENLTFLQSCLDNISNDGKSDGIEFGNVRPIVKLKSMDLDYYKNSVLKDDKKIGMYFSKWNTYKTHGESEQNINYFTDSFTNMMDIVQNKLGYSIDVISDDKLLTDINEYELIIIPTQIIVSDSAQNKIADYMSNGGKVLIDYRYAETNEYEDSSLYQKFLESENIQGTQALNEDKYIREKESNGLSSIRIPKNENNLPSSYLLAVDDDNELFIDEYNNNVGYEDENLIYFGFQPQNIYAQTNNDVYIEVIDLAMKKLLK